MRLRGVFLKALTDFFSALGLFEEDQIGTRIITYHSLGGISYRDNLGLSSIRKDFFLKNMEIISKLGFEVGNLIPNTLNRFGEKKRIAITFDDGYRDVLEILDEISTKYSFPITIFVTSDFVKNNLRGFLSKSDLRYLGNLSNITIGSHGKSHLSLIGCNHADLKEELMGSKSYLEDIVGREINCISYPYGHVNPKVVSLASEVGYKCGATSIFGINKEFNNPMMLKRTAILSDDTVDSFKNKLSGKWDWYRFRQAEYLRYLVSIA